MWQSLQPDIQQMMEFHAKHNRKYDPYYVYGFKDEGDCRGTILPKKAVEEAGLEMFGLDVVRLHLGDVVYGIKIPVGSKATSEQQHTVEKALKQLTSSYEMGPCKTGYFAAMQGTYSTAQSEEYRKKKLE